MKNVMSTLLILAISFSFSCKNHQDKSTDQNSLKSPEVAEKNELPQLDGYLDTKWGQTKEEVISILEGRGLKRAKKGEWGNNEFVVEEAALEHFDNLLDLLCIVVYGFEDNELTKVFLYFTSSLEERMAKWDDLKSLLVEKYKSAFFDGPDWALWETSNTIIRLYHGINPFWSFLNPFWSFLKEDKDEIILGYFGKNHFYKELEGSLSGLIKKVEEAKKKI